MLSTASQQQLDLNILNNWVEWDVSQYSNARISAFRHVAFAWATATLRVEGSAGGGSWFSLSIAMGPPATATTVLDSGNIDTSDLQKIRVIVTAVEGSESYAILNLTAKSLT